MFGPLNKMGQRLTNHLQRVPRRVNALRAARVQRDEVMLVSTAGYQLRARVHRMPQVAGKQRPRPGVLLCPGIDDPGSAFEGFGSPVSADEVARLGTVVLQFDPAGRGKSWGNEDYGGPEHQDDVQVALRYLLGRDDVVPRRSGVLSISLGVAMATGALAAAGESLPVSWFIDWEGPCDREIITSGGRIMAPAAGHDLEDERYWRPREAVQHVGRLRCGYFRYQSRRDHAQPGELRHAMRMMRAASEGDLPWFQLNDHPRGVMPDNPQYYPAGHGAANRILQQKIRQFSGL